MSPLELHLHKITNLTEGDVAPKDKSVSDTVLGDSYVKRKICCRNQL